MISSGVHRGSEDNERLGRQDDGAKVGAGARNARDRRLTSIGEAQALCDRYQTSSCGRERRELLEALLARHETILRGLARWAMRRPDASCEYEDALQHARLAAIQAYGSYDPSRGAALPTYLHMKVRGCFREAFAHEALVRVPARAMCSRSKEPPNVGRHYGNATDPVLALEEVRDIAAPKGIEPHELVAALVALERCPERHRPLLSMVAAEEDRDEIAREMGISLVALKGRLFKIREKMRADMV